MNPSPGDRIGPYEIVGALGAGGMGQVYRARDTRLNRVVAVKALHESFAAHPERVAVSFILTPERLVTVRYATSPRAFEVFTARWASSSCAEG